MYRRGSTSCVYRRGSTSCVHYITSSKVNLLCFSLPQKTMCKTLVVGNLLQVAVPYIQQTCILTQAYLQAHKREILDGNIPEHHPHITNAVRHFEMLDLYNLVRPLCHHYYYGPLFVAEWEKYLEVFLFRAHPVAFKLIQGLEHVLKE